jgi:hypothetical protein
LISNKVEVIEMAPRLNRRALLAGLLTSVPSATGIAGLLTDCENLFAADPNKESAKQPPRITLSKETTFITEPLGPDGYPDYVAALNQICSSRRVGTAHQIPACGNRLRVATSSCNSWAVPTLR